MIVFFTADIKAGFVSNYHKQFNFLCILSVIINYILIILIHLTIIKSAAPMLLLFNGLVFAVTIMIGTNMRKYGYFKKKYENE